MAAGVLAGVSEALGSSMEMNRTGRKLAKNEEGEAE
jgi:hypothetical protein